MPGSIDVQPRKRPRQERARETERALLGAAERVLREEGASAFNTNRVAEVAGVSVGSLYQYFPNKAAILFRLHVLENATTFATVSAALEGRRGSPRERLRDAVHAFFQTEAAEAPLRDALELARVAHRDSPEYRGVEARGEALVRGFLSEVLEEGTHDLDHEARLVYGLVTSLAEHATRSSSRRVEVERWADDCTDLVAERLGLA